MTVIAWDGVTLAADRLVGCGGVKIRGRKIHYFGEFLLGLAGDADIGEEMRHWFMDGRIAKDFPASARGDKATLIAISAAGILRFDSGPYPLHIEDDKCAWGSGSDFARAAMHLGCDAKAAVEVACLFVTSCGCGIDTLMLGAS